MKMKKTVSLPPRASSNSSGELKLGIAKLSMAQGVLKANLLQKVGAASGLSMTQPVNINPKFLP
jgi:hypothetical protein